MGGLIVRGADNIGYYAWLRSPLIDGDFDFENDYAPLFTHYPACKAAINLTATGRRENHWPVGPALVWAPAVITVHLVLVLLGPHSPWAADGYSPPYQLAVGGTTLALALLTLYLTFRIARRVSGPRAAAAAAALITLGTPVVVYGTVDVSMAHGPASAALALFAFFWLRTFGSVGVRRWFGIGCLLGATALMRWQLATFAVLPILEAMWLTIRTHSWRARIGVAIRILMAGLAAIVTFTPQLVAKQIVYGHPLGGLHETAHNWLNPSLCQVLWSTDRSLFYWTPITLLAVTGLVYLTLRRFAGALKTQPQPQGAAVAIMIGGIAFQIYTVSALLGRNVFLGSSFGFRLLTETCVLMVPGIAVLFERLNDRTSRRLAAGGALLVACNLLLLGVCRHGGGGPEGGDPATVLALVGLYLFHRPLEAIGLCALAGWITYVLIAAFRPEDDVASPRREPIQERLAA
jgi:hypothetical protein